MAEVIEMFIPMLLEPKQGDRSHIVRTKSGKSFIAHYTPKKVKKSAATMASLIAPWVPARPLEGPLRLTVDFYYPWRKSESKKAQAGGMIAKSTKPDIDNLLKNLADTMQASCFFVNDSQLADVRIRKWWHRHPGIEVKLETVA
jgi:Holliday junction resolvase RusA-like endonuclease